MLAVRAHDLEEHLTGLFSCRKPFLLVKSDDGVSEIKVVNNQFFVWKRFDKLPIGWLISSISSDLFSLMSGCSTTNEMWESLKAYFISE